jgi:hypothetical protein
MWQANAEFTGERRLAKRDDDRVKTHSPGAHMDAHSRSSGATFR